VSRGAVIESQARRLLIRSRRLATRPGRLAGRFLAFAASPAATAVAVVFAGGVAIRVAFMALYRPAFLGVPDSGTYIDAAHHALFSDVYETAGYSLVIRIAHAVFPHLSALILVQHLLGIATAGLLYYAVRRVTGSTLAGLIPAVVVLFDGFGLWVEHSPLSDPLFSFLVTCVLLLALVAADSRPWVLAVEGALIGVTVVVRPVGLVLVPIVVVWIAGHRSGATASRILAGVALIVPACAVLGAYMFVQRADTGFFGLTQTTGRLIYARGAPFADCSRFKPPAGTAALCEKTPSRDRGSVNQYETGYSDHLAAGMVVNRSISPAWRVFGSPPNGNGKLLAFGLTAIVHQPLDYLSIVAHDVHNLWADDHHAFMFGDAVVDPDVERAVTSYYVTGAGVSGGGLVFLRWYGRWIQLRGVLVIVLLLIPLIGVFTPRRGARRAAILFALAGWLVPLATVATAAGNSRYLLPGYGPLAAAAALGLAGWRRPPAVGPAGLERPQRAAAPPAAGHQKRFAGAGLPAQSPRPVLIDRSCTRDRGFLWRRTAETRSLMGSWAGVKQRGAALSGRKIDVNDAEVKDAE